MKPCPFDYHSPRTLDQALALLATLGEEAKVLAGGQSLIPLMNLRLARPAHLIDINHIPGLRGLRSDGQTLTIGAATRHRELAADGGGSVLRRLLAEASGHIGHWPIRTRGTFGGSLAHADAAAEWCLLARLLDAEIVLRRALGERTVPAADFFTGTFETATAPDEILTEIRLAELAPDHRVGLAEFARRPGDFAVVAAAVDVCVSADRIRTARIALGGVADVPCRAATAEELARGAPASLAGLGPVIDVVADGLHLRDDAHISGGLRKDLARSAVTQAFARALGQEQPTGVPRGHSWEPVS